MRVYSLVLLMVGAMGGSFSWGDESYGTDRSEAAASPRAIVSTEGKWRHPVRAILDEKEGRLFVLCQRVPSLHVIPLNDPSRMNVIPLSGSPASMTRLAGDSLAIVDQAGDAVVHFTGIETDDQRWSTFRVGVEPREILAHPSQPLVWVSCRGDRTVWSLDLATGQTRWKTSLSFSPHALAVDSKTKMLVVADAYRGTLAVLDPDDGRVISQHLFPGTNIRGLVFSPDDQTILFTHQIISEQSIIERESVRWGSFITNNIRRIRREVLADPSADVIRGSELGFVGGFGHGAGDPGRLVYPKEGHVSVCLEGVQEIGIDSGWPLRFDRVRVGRRPVDIAIDRAVRRGYVVNRFDDAVSVVDLERGQLIESISLGPIPEETPAMRGEVLFHDASISLDSWYSCQSCHTDGETNGSNADTLSDGGYGSPKNTPSLVGVAHTPPWSWVGGFEKLEDQIASTIQHTMQSNYVSRGRAEDLAAFLSTLEPRPMTLVGPSQRGRDIFDRVGCASCHAGSHLTRPSVEDVGLNDGLAGHDQFNPPSLRRVFLTPPYFHDGRAKTLEEVIDVYRHRLDDPLPADDREALLAYLKSL